jgi:uncharacterized protein
MKMKKVLSLLVLCVCCLDIMAQTFEQEVVNFQNELDEEFKNPEESPLTKKERKQFKGHNYFPIDEGYRVEAKFVKTEEAVPFQMKTTTDRLPIYEKFGEVIFELQGQTLKLNIYQSHQLRQTEKYGDYLFLPFTDLTNGEETYGGGRYIDLKIPSSDTIIIDFNKSYTPSCAYNHAYSCPIPPVENDLNISIKAGVKNIKASK